MTSRQAQDPRSAEAIAAFAVDLKIVRRHAGDTPYRQLATTTGYSIATITRALKGEILPSWDFTKAFLTACGADDLDRWRNKWTEIMDLVDPLPRSTDDAQETAPPTGAECDTCGAWVTNSTLHTQWHATFVPNLAVITNGDTRKRNLRRLIG